MYHISDLLVRIKNSLQRGRGEFSIPHSNIKENILGALSKDKYIEDYKVYKEGKFKYLKVILKTEDNPITNVKAISKPGRRIYNSVNNLKSNKSGLGILVLSTPKGVLSDKDAIKANVGGEVLFKIW